MDEKRSEVLEVDEHDQPLPPPPRPDPIPRPNITAANKQRRLNEGEKLLAEMEASETKRRRLHPHDADDAEDAHSREKESRREELIKAAQSNRGGLLPRPSASPPLLPPPPPSPPPPRLHVHYPDPLAGDEGWAADDDPLSPPSSDDVALITSTAADADDDVDSASPFSPHFLPDFSHLIPRPPLLPLSSSSVAFHNLWAHFMHVQRRPITGHHVLLQHRSVTAWDVYRVVTEHGGYHRTLTHRLFHPVLSAICHSSPPVSPSVLSSPLPGGPPVPIAHLHPRTFFIDYYERFLYPFELAYQWDKGTAPGVVPPPGRTVASVVEGKRRRRKTSGGVRADLLKRLWAPSYHAVLFKEKAGGGGGEEDGGGGGGAGGGGGVAGGEEEEPALGYVGMTRLKRSVESGVVEEVTAAINRLLRLTWRLAKGKGGGGGGSGGGGGAGAGAVEEDEVDDDEDASDACLLFHTDIISSLLPLLLHPPLHTPSLSFRSPHPSLTPLLVHSHLQNLASFTPDFHTATLVILHNLSLHPPSHHRLAAHTTALNVLAHVVCDPSTETVMHADGEGEAWGLAVRAVMGVMGYVCVREVVRREELVRAMVGVLQRWLDGAVWGGGGREGGAEGGGREEEEEEVECVAAVLGGFVGLLTNPHHAVNIPYLLTVLPSPFFSLLLTLASPLTPSPLIRNLATHALTFFCLSHRTFASRLVQVRGLPALMSVLCRGGKGGEEGVEGGGRVAEGSDGEKELRRATAATVQAIVSYCVVSGGEEARREGLLWSAVWKLEADIFTACCLDADVSALLVPALQRSALTRQQATAEAGGA